MTKEEAIEILSDKSKKMFNAQECIEHLARKKQALDMAIKALEQEPILDKIKGYINHIKNTGLGKKKSLEFIEKFIDGLKAESEDKE